jgi:hypothetical protein
MNSMQITVQFLRLAGMSYMSNSENSDLGSLIQKSLLHYIQVVAILGLDKIPIFVVPTAVSILPDIVGDPV